MAQSGLNVKTLRILDGGGDSLGGVYILFDELETVYMIVGSKERGLEPTQVVQDAMLWKFIYEMESDDQSAADAIAQNAEPLPTT